MPATVPVYQIGELASLAELFKLPFSKFTQDWYGHLVNFEASFLIALSEANLYFAARCSEKPHCEELKKGTFKSGLWEKNVVEFFIKEDSSNRYQEFNFSPAGAWWTGVFSDYRVTTKSRPTPPTVNIETKTLGIHGWQIAAAIPRTELEVSAEFKSATKINAAFMLGQKNQHYLSWSTPLTDKPDFHLVHDYPTISLKRLVSFNVFY